MSNPIAAAFAATPHWMLNIQIFDGLEIHPCRVIEFLNRTEIIEVCEPKAAHFFTVYGHRREGGVEAFEDFSTVITARAFAARLLAAYSNLQHHGLLDCGG